VLVVASFFSLVELIRSRRWVWFAGRGGKWGWDGEGDSSVGLGGSVYCYGPEGEKARRMERCDSPRPYSREFCGERSWSCSRLNLKRQDWATGATGATGPPADLDGPGSAV
jgi:hypothetical protein